MINTKKIILAVAVFVFVSPLSTFAMDTTITTSSGQNIYSVGERTLDDSDYKVYEDTVINKDYYTSGDVKFEGGLSVLEKSSYKNENGNVVINGDVVFKDCDKTKFTGIEVKNGTLIINGNVTMNKCHNNGDLIRVSGGNVVINGNVSMIGSDINGSGVRVENGNLTIVGTVAITGKFNGNSIKVTNGNIYLYLKKPEGIIQQELSLVGLPIANYAYEGIETIYYNSYQSEDLDLENPKKEPSNIGKIKVYIPKDTTFIFKDSNFSDVYSSRFYSFGKFTANLGKERNPQSGFFAKIDPVLDINLTLEQQEKILSEMIQSTSAITSLKGKLKSSYDSKNDSQAESYRLQIISEKERFLNSLNNYVNNNEFDKNKLEEIKQYEINTTLNYLNSFSRLGQFKNDSKIEKIDTSEYNNTKKTNSEETQLKTQPTVSSDEVYTSAKNSSVNPSKKESIKKLLENKIKKFEDDSKKLTFLENLNSKLEKAIPKITNKKTKDLYVVLNEIVLEMIDELNDSQEIDSLLN